jgi:hypothetical protein
MGSPLITRGKLGSPLKTRGELGFSTNNQGVNLGYQLITRGELGFSTNNKGCTWAVHPWFLVENPSLPLVISGEPKFTPGF